MSSMAILFADVCGSTKIYEKLGDERARRLLGGCIARMSEAAAAHGGVLIKTIGDEVMCRFSSAAVSGIGVPLSIHVGFTFGEVVEEGGDIFGDAVNVAARMVNIVKADQIITTGATVAALS